MSDYKRKRRKRNRKRQGKGSNFGQSNRRAVSMPQSAVDHPMAQSTFKQLVHRAQRVYHGG